MIPYPMRSLIIQFSLLVAALTASHLLQVGIGLLPSLLWACSAGCTTWALLLLGDFAVHRLMDDMESSARITENAPYVEADSREDIQDMDAQKAA